MHVFLVLVGFLISAQAMANSPVGTFMVVKGDVSVVHSDGKTEKARIGLKVYPKDVIQTLKDARGKIVMVDKNVINLSPDTKLQIQDYTFKPDENKKSVLLNLMYGKVRPQVNQKYDEKENTFRVKTTAAVAGVRGTDFIVSFQNNQAQVTTFEGMVSVGSGIDSANQISNFVSVPAGQATTVATNAAPQPPVVVPPAQLTSLDKDSSADGKAIENRQPANNPQGPAPKAPGASTGSPTSGGTANNGGTGDRAPSSIPTLLPPPPPLPINEVPVVPGPIAGLPPTTVPNLPLPIAPPVNPIIGDIIQQTNTSVNLIIVGPNP